jgi:DNA mismatch repair protein MutL
MANTPIPEINSAGNQFHWSTPWARDPDQKHKEIDPAWQMSSDEPRKFEPGQESNVDQHSFPRISIPLLRLVGQVASSYLVAEGPDGLYLIDQHAAHERVLFERLMSQKETSIPIQTLLEPAVVEFAPAETRLLEEHLEKISGLGFQVEPFGQGTYLVRGVPTLLSHMNPSAALRVLVEDFEEDETPLGNELEAKLIGRICKRAAVKAGQVLSEEEQKGLLEGLESCRSPRTCPHGRPTMIHLSVDLLARQFGRR